MNNLFTLLMQRGYVLLMIAMIVFIGNRSVQGQSNHTVTFTGSTSDFTTAEKISAAANNTDYYITFDASNLYIAAFRTSGTFGGTDNLAIYIDSDPNATSTSGTGTTTGQNYNSVSGTLPFSANFNVHAEQSFQEGRSFASSWASTISGVTYFTSTTAREVKIPNTSIGSPKALYLTMWMGFAGGFFSNVPGSNLGSSGNPTITNYFGGFGNTSASCTPTTITNTPITDQVVNAQPQSGATYGYASVTDASSHSATGSFTIASGGSINISNAGGTLVINSGTTISMSTGSTINKSAGAFTNNAGSIVQFNGTGYILGGSAPTFRNLTLASNASVTASNAVAISTSSGTLTINSGATYEQTSGTLSLNSGSSASITGILKNSSAISDGGTITFNSGGKYQHNINAGAVPSSIWSTGSTCEIIGSTANPPTVSTLTQSFYNFTWNCAAQSAANNLSGNLQTVQGAFTIQSTNGNELRLTNTTALALTITGDLILQSGTLNLSSGAGGGTLNLGGNYNQTGGTFTSSGAIATLAFTGGSSSATFTRSGGTFTGTNINFQVASSKTLTLNNALTIASSRTLTVDGTLATGVTLTNSGTTTINGSFQINQGGFASGTNFVYGSSSTLAFNNSSGSYGVNNDVYWPSSSGPPNVNVKGAGGITMNVARTVSGTFQYAAGVSSAGNLTLNGTSQVNTGGFTSGSPTYGSSSTLKYNVNASYGRNGEWLPGATSGAGYPNNVQLSNNTNLDLPNGSPGSTFQCGGDLAIDAGSTLSMVGGSPSTQPLTVVGNMNLPGTLTLSTSSGGDIKVSGNWSFTVGGTLNSNGRAVFFSGGGTQVISRSAAGTLNFDYLINSKTAGTLQLSSGTNVNVNAPSGGNGLQLLADVPVDLNGNTFTLAANASIQIAGTESITSSAGTGTFAITGGAAPPNVNGSGSLTFSSSVLINLNGGFDFGLTTVNGTLSMNTGSFISNTPPTYGSGSLLKYNSGTNPYIRGNEWNATSGAGYPNNVQVSNNTSLDVGGGAAGVAKQIAGNLTVDAGSGFFLDFGSNDMTQPVTVLGNLSIDGSLSLSDAIGGDLILKGNWTRAGTFTPKSRAVFLQGTSAQTITGQTTFDYLLIDKTGGSVTLNNNIILNQTLTFTATDVININTGSNNVQTGSTGSVSRAASTSGWVNGNLLRFVPTGSGVVRSFDIGDDMHYLPVTITFASVTVAGNLTGHTTTGDHLQISSSHLKEDKSVPSYWTFTKDGSLAFTTYDAIFNWPSGYIDSGADPLQFVIGKFD